LAALFLPVLNKAKIKAQPTSCLSNLRQLGLAWVLYYTDNNGRLVESYPVNNPNAWILGDVRNPSEATNIDLLYQGKLYAYNRNIGIYRCPADRGVKVETKVLAADRSYSMNSFMGARDASVGPIPANAGRYVLFYAKDHEIPKPSSAWTVSRRLKPLVTRTISGCKAAICSKLGLIPPPTLAFFCASAG